MESCCSGLPGGYRSWGSGCAWKKMSRRSDGILLQESCSYKFLRSKSNGKVYYAIGDNTSNSPFSQEFDCPQGGFYPFFRHKSPTFVSFLVCESLFFSFRGTYMRAVPHWRTDWTCHIYMTLVSAPLFPLKRACFGVKIR